MDMLSKSSKTLSTRKKREFGFANLQQPKYDKDGPNKQPPKNQSKKQENKGKGKTKSDIQKWCDFHKIPWHNTDEGCSKQSLVDDIEEKHPNSDSEFD